MCRRLWRGCGCGATDSSLLGDTNIQGLVRDLADDLVDMGEMTSLQERLAHVSHDGLSWQCTGGVF